MRSSDAAGDERMVRVGFTDVILWMSKVSMNIQQQTTRNLSPLISSTVDVKYKLLTCRGVGVDSTYLLTSPADSVYRSVLSANITGFQIALMAMNVGDSCEVVIPYQQAYSNSGKGTILPYSHLHYFLKLKDIYKYQKK